jgi:hypothetical protein
MRQRTLLGVGVLVVISLVLVACSVTSRFAPGRAAATPVDLQMPLIVGAGSTGPATVNGQAGQTLRVQPGSASAGQKVAVDGTGFAPDADGQLRIQSSSRSIDLLFLRVHTDGSGNFHADGTWPDYTTLPPDIYQLHLVFGGQ